MDLHDFRRNYSLGRLSRQDLATNPFEQFRVWLEQIVAADTADPTAMIVATANDDGQPSQRYVLLKHFDEAGFVFFTDTSSQKGQEIANNPKVSLLFPWHQFERQVRIAGVAKQLPRDAVEEYFYSRPVLSQQAAICSKQSQAIESRADLEAQFDAVKQAKDKQLPERWSGYLVNASSFEFWQGGENRLHDRFRYTLDIDKWSIIRLQP